MRRFTPGEVEKGAQGEEIRRAAEEEPLSLVMPQGKPKRCSGGRAGRRGGPKATDEVDDEDSTTRASRLPQPRHHKPPLRGADAAILSSCVCAWLGWVGDECLCVACVRKVERKGVMEGQQGV